MGLPFRPEQKLGFGLMRLPVDEKKKIDMEHMKRMVDAFMESGCTYFDTAYVYHRGKSESAIREALVERYPRERFTLATKLPAWSIKQPSDVQQIFNTQLRRTGAGYFDYYLLHSVETEHIPVYEKYDCWRWAMKMKEQGLIRHFGFSFHDSAEILDGILTAHPEAEFVQLQLNYLDWENSVVQSRACYEAAARHGVPVIVMEPVKGGTLADMPEGAASILKAARPDASLASWALRFCGSLDNVMCVLSGMSDDRQMADNIATMTRFEPLTAEERSLVKRAADVLLSTPTVPCTGCRYCVDGCPMGIPIPDLISCLNNARLYGMNHRAEVFYERFAEGGAPASACVACGQCEGVCPQHLKVIDVMSEAAAAFEHAENK